MHDIKKANIRKNNMKLYPIYKMVGFDLMFLYAIQILFLIQVKGTSTSEAVMLGAFYAIFSIIFSIPLNIVVSRIGKKNSMLLGNIFNLIYILMLIFGNHYIIFVLGEFFEAIGFALKGITESAFLNESIPKAKEKSEIFTRIDGSGYSKYSYFNAMAMLLSGILYDVNPYIPLLCAGGCIVFAIILCANFEHTSDLYTIVDGEEDKDKPISQILTELKLSLKFIIKSNRLRALLLMSATIIGLVKLMVSYSPALLEAAGCSATIIGIISAIMELAKGFFSNKANEFNKLFRNKSLTILIITVTLSMIISGAILLIKVPFLVQVSIITLAFTLIYMSKGIYQVLRCRYLNNFSNSKFLHNLYSVDGILENVSRMTVTFIATIFLNLTNIKWSIIIVGVLFLFIGLLISKYMKKRVGLKPEEYSKEDIEFTID